MTVRHVTTAEDVLLLLDALDSHRPEPRVGSDQAVDTQQAVARVDGDRAAGAQRAEVCVGGGWAVDALLGEQTREHSDVDLWIPAADLEWSFRAFTAVGIDRLLPTPGDRPWNFVLHDGDRRKVDLHLYELRPDGRIHYGSALNENPFPAEALSGQGEINDRPVRCEAAAWSVQWHTGYPPRPADYQDVRLLCARFDLPVPTGFT